MKYNVTVGSQSGQVEINPDGNGGFTGVVTHTKFGDGQITNGTVTGNNYKGTVNLDGHNADFTATLSGNSISGVVTPTGIAAMFYDPASFSGTEASA